MQSRCVCQTGSTSGTNSRTGSTRGITMCLERCTQWATSNHTRRHPNPPSLRSGSSSGRQLSPDFSTTRECACWPKRTRSCRQDPRICMSCNNRMLTTCAVSWRMSKTGKVQAPTPLKPSMLTRTRGVASVAIRSLAIAAECLVSRREQEEVLDIFDRIQKETGWRTGFLHKELKEKWGWNNEEQYQQQQQQNIPASMLPLQSYQYQASNLPPVPPPPSLKQGPRQGIINPILRSADFSAPTHPYQSHYVAPLHLPPQPHYSQY